MKQEERLSRQSCLPYGTQAWPNKQKLKGNISNNDY